MERNLRRKAQRVLQESWQMLGDASIYRFQSDAEAIRTWELILDSASHLEKQTTR
jgi:hypothetical protein